MRPTTDLPAHSTPPVALVFIGATAAILLVAFCLRIYNLGTQELWLDETRSWYMTTVMNWIGPQSLGENNTPPLYYLLLRAWSRIAGDSPEALRGPSVLTGTVFVGAAIWVGREIFDAHVGLWTGVLAALSPMQIFYSQEARSYVLLMLLLVVCYGLLFRALKTNAFGWWLAYGIVSVLALHCHYMAVIGLAPNVVMVFAWPTSGISRWLRYGGATLGAAVLLIPWLLASFYFTDHLTGDLGFMKLYWERLPPSMAVLRSFEIFGLGSVTAFQLKQFALLEFPWQLRWLGIGTLLVIGTVAVLPYADSRLGIAFLCRRKAWLVSALLLPLLALWAGSYLIKPLYSVGRYDMVAFPAFLLFMGLGLTKCVRMPRVGVVVGPIIGALLLSVMAAKLMRYYTAGNAHISARAVASWIGTTARSGDVVVVSREFGLPVRYFLTQKGYQCGSGYCRDERGNRFAYRQYPLEMEKYPLGRHLARVRGSRAEVQKDLRQLLEPLARPDGAVWLITRIEAISEDGKWLVPGIENDLGEELVRVGFTGKFINLSPAILKFQRRQQRVPN